MRSRSASRANRVRSSNGSVRTGGESEPHGDGLLVRLHDGETPTVLWQIAAELGEQIRSLRPQRSTLEEVFLKAVGEKA